MPQHTSLLVTLTEVLVLAAADIVLASTAAGRWQARSAQLLCMAVAVVPPTMAMMVAAVPVAAVMATTAAEGTEHGLRPRELWRS